MKKLNRCGHSLVMNSSNPSARVRMRPVDSSTKGVESMKGVRGSLIGERRRVMEGLIDVVMEAVGEENAGLVSGEAYEGML